MVDGHDNNVAVSVDPSSCMYDMDTREVRCFESNGSSQPFSMRPVICTGSYLVAMVSWEDDVISESTPRSAVGSLRMQSDGRS
jgi:hypothetical protein